MIKKKIPFVFCDKLFYDINKTFCARMQPLISKDEMLIEALFYLLWFPGYFGFNWNAVYDCLRDFHWMPYNKIVLIHDALPALEEEDLKHYLEVLQDCVFDWKERKKDRFEVIFKKSDQAKIEEILS